MIRRLYDWTMSLAASRHAERALAGVSFIESSVFPIPPDVMLAPMCLARPERSLRYALIATIASVLGGLLGYAIGYFFFETVGQWVIDLYGYHDRFEAFQLRFNEMGWLLVLIAGFTPFPFKVITITAGLTHLDPLTFVAASLISRAGRFYLVAILLWRFGAPIQAFIDRRLGLLTSLFAILLVGGFVAVRYL